MTPDQIEHARKLIDKGEARKYVAGPLNVGRSVLYAEQAKTPTVHVYGFAAGAGAFAFAWLAFLTCSKYCCT
jgi:hypothetical protein